MYTYGSINNFCNNLVLLINYFIVQNNKEKNSNYVKLFTFVQPNKIIHR